MAKRKLKDTKVGDWLRRKAPDVLDTVGEFLPEKGVLGLIKNLIDNEPDISHEERMDLEKLIVSQQSIKEQELTKRWESDNKSDSWLSKHTRPLIVLSLVAALFLFIILDSLEIAFNVRDSWVSLYEVLILTAVGGYFALRSVFDKKKQS
mgnify:CR=1 FL=1|tara:strand:+ start:206 stop:655 length:450 start_codon:yes stop_codon:yes gene_type:complete